MPRHNSTILFFTGAPLPSTLERSEETYDSEHLLPAFSGELKEKRAISSPANVYPQWRRLTLASTHLPTGLTQATLSDGELCFATTSDLLTRSVGHGSSKDRLSPPSNIADELSQFYEHSFAIHDGADMQGNTESFGILTDDESCFSSAESGSVDAVQHQTTRLRLSRSEITSLQDLPSAGQLRSLLPQTVTVNLIFGIIAISKPRVIVTRKGNRRVELVEILAGDETRSGFSISLWIKAETQSDGVGRSAHLDDDLRLQALSLRPRDIVLARFVALGTFKGKVHGQSLRRGITTLDLLYCDPVDAEDCRSAFRARDFEGGYTEERNLGKVNDTRDWVTRFVGGGSGPGRRNNIATPLPADSQ